MGRTRGLPEAKRRMLLKIIYNNVLQRINNHDYMAEWGTEKSVIRLQKLADTIAASARNAKRRNNPPGAAIEEWEADLDYLKHEYYTGRFDFYWPSTYANVNSVG